MQKQHPTFEALTLQLLDENLHIIALSLIEYIGPVMAKRLIDHAGSAEAVFACTPKSLAAIPGMGPKKIHALTSQSAIDKAHSEIETIKTKGLKAITFLDNDYPQRLLECLDGPIVLYAKGQSTLNAPRTISIVGTRHPSSVGLSNCTALIEALTPYHPTIVSGLAHGIDVCAHRAALQYGLPTIACLAHGLKYIYPALHRNVAQQIELSGTLLTEHHYNQRAEQSSFPRRNRIIAGLSDATIVVESMKKGGSMITAEMALSYNREVFTFPGRPTDELSSGCHRLIRTNGAALISNAEDLIYSLGWDHQALTPLPKPKKADLSPEEATLYGMLSDQGKQSIDALSQMSELSSSTLAMILLNLEFKGVLKVYPGKIYEAL